MAVAGIDGCKLGWLVVTVPEAGDVIVECIPDLSSVLGALDSGRLAAVGIDIPLGLPAVGPRSCDTEARKLIGPRASSVFPAPARAVLGAESYSDALGRSRAACGKGLSKQTFGILPKIASVDALLTPARQRHLVEVHPEVSFRLLAGRPMSHRKLTPEGRSERLIALRGPFPKIDAQALARPRGAAPDDVLDAFVAAWSARRWLTGNHIQLGGELDEHGLRMEIIA